MILGGVFERFPDLRVAFVETEVALDRRRVCRASTSASSMGDDWLGVRRVPRARPAVQQLAERVLGDELLRRRLAVHAGADPDGRLARARATTPAEFQHRSDHAMFGVDYPHFETIYPATFDQVAPLVGEPAITDAELQRILYDNAADLYGFDLDALEPHVERVGFDTSDLAA